jgi:hypothetical protein
MEYEKINNVHDLWSRKSIGIEPREFRFWKLMDSKSQNNEFHNLPIHPKSHVLTWRLPEEIKLWSLAHKASAPLPLNYTNYTT